MSTQPSERLEKVVSDFRNTRVLLMAQGDADDQPDNPLFHYTKEQAFNSIIKSQEFWFTSIYHMDDEEELDFGMGVSRSLLKAASDSGDSTVAMNTLMSAVEGLLAGKPPGIS